MFSKFLNFYRKNREYYLLILSIIIVSSPLILYNLPATHDGYWHLNWAYHWNQQVFSGQFYPRWFEDAFGGLGTPTFSFYPPLFRSLSLPFAFLGLSATQQIIGSIIIVFMINGLGSLIYAKLIFGSKIKTFIYVSVLLAIFNPYLIINIFIRGAWAEACAMSLIPWILIGTKLSMEGNHKLKELPLLISYSLLNISHLPTLLILTFLYLSYPFFLISQSFSTTKKYIKNVCIPIGLSFCLTSFYLVPVYFDRALTFIYSSNTKVQYNQDLHFLIDNILNFNPNFPSDFDNTLVSVFLLSTLVLTIFISLLASNRHTPGSILSVQDLRLIAFLSFISLLMNTDLSRPIYFLIPILNKIQFAWRFLSVSTTLLPFVCATILLILTQKTIRNKYKVSVKLFVMFFIILGLVTSYRYSIYHHIKFDSNTMQEVDIYLSRNFVSKKNSIKNDKNNVFKELVVGQNNMWGIFLTNKNELITVDVMDYFFSRCFNPDYWNNTKIPWVILPKQNYPLIEWDKGFGEISSLEWAPGLRRFNVKTNTLSTLNLKTIYYPGWRISINSVSLANNSFRQKQGFSCAPDGRIQLNLPPGEFNILVSYDGTNAENIASRISLIPLISTVIYLVLSLVQKTPLRL